MKPRTVLIVDDDEDFRLQMKLQLESAGFEVQSVEGEAAAEAALERFRPDLAVVDLMMEHQDGGFALSYRMKKKYPDLPVIIVTGVTSETGLAFDLNSRGERSWIKADALLPKPVRFEQLRREIDRLLPEQRS
jgi:two-component system, OmpR family, response regulator